MPDTLDGRFAMLATIARWSIVRLEQLGEAGNALSVALTERFIEVMEAEHRELGLGDPTPRQDGAQAGRLAGAPDGTVALGDRGGRRLARVRRQSLYKGEAGAQRRCTMLRRR